MESSTATEAATGWEPNQELLDMLVGMGISKITAEHALYYTGNQSAEAAASYVFDNPDIEEMPPMFKVKSRSKHKDQEKLENEAGSSSEEEAESTEKYKMVFVVNTALNMGVGKIASQVAHACLGLYRLLTEYEYMGDVADNWERDGAKKVVLRGKNELHLDELETQARAKQLFTYLLHDAGRTQIPANSVTVLAVFGPCQRVDKVTGELSLL